MLTADKKNKYHTETTRIRLGKNQRAILEIFPAKPDQIIDTMVMTILVFKNKTVFECTNFQLGSIRRALQKLAKAGYLVDLIQMNRSVYERRILSILSLSDWN